MANAAYRAKVYADTGKKNAAGATILTRGRKARRPQADLKGRMIDLQVGNLYVQDLSDFGKKNEAYIEITVQTRKGNDRIGYPFKLQVDVKDGSFSAALQGREVITGVEVVGTGIDVEFRLTELDKIDPNKFSALQGFVEDNDIGEQAKVLAHAAGLPFNPREIARTLFRTVSLIDMLNDDDRIWAEFPKFDLRATGDFALFEGAYALVQDPRRVRKKHPVTLYEAGGELYISYDSDEVNVPFTAANYLTWSFIAQ